MSAVGVYQGGCINHYGALQTEDILWNIFMNYVAEPRQIIAFSVVNRLWHHVANDRDLWKIVCKQLGLVLPFDSTRTMNAFRYELTSFFLNQVKECRSLHVECIDLGIEDISNYQVRFVQDKYVLLLGKSNIAVVELVGKRVINEISLKHEISSVCTSQKSVFLSLANFTIEAYPLDRKCENPLFTVDYQEREFACKAFASFYGPARPLANDKWLISDTGVAIRQWNAITGDYVATTLWYADRSLHIAQNKLFLIQLAGTIQQGVNSNLAVYYCDLDQQNLRMTSMGESSKDFLTLAEHTCLSIPPLVNTTIYSKHMREYRSFLENKDTSHFPQDELSTKMVQHFADTENQSCSVGHNSRRFYLNMVSHLAIFMHSQQLGATFYQDDIYFIDMKDNAILHTISRKYYGELKAMATIDQISNPTLKITPGSITVFHDTLLYLDHANHIVKITTTIPKRKAGEEVESSDSKKMRQ